jgi:hypothetical protein
MNKSDDFTKMDDKEVLEKIKIKNAYRKLLRNDSHLLEVDANERSITHRFAIYLEDEFPDYNVDCEYNRNDTDIKKIKKIDTTDKNINIELISKQYISATDAKGNTVSVYPDIIIHRRGTNDGNFIAIEAKKTTTNNNNNDEDKLRAYKNDFLKYRHAFFVEFPVKNNFSNFNGNLDNYIRQINTRQKN